MQESSIGQQESVNSLRIRAGLLAVAAGCFLVNAYTGFHDHQEQSPNEHGAWYAAGDFFHAGEAFQYPDVDLKGATGLLFLYSASSNLLTARQRRQEQ